jgi:5'-nucleotidase
VSGLRLLWDPSQPPGKRVVKIEVPLSTGWGPIEPGKTYRVATNDYMVSGGDDYTMLKAGANINNLGFMLYEVLADYIRQNSPVNPPIDGRILQVDKQ